MNFHSNPLITDLYQLTMLQAYFDQKFNQTAVFECFIRRRTANRRFFIAAGLEVLLDYLENLQFNSAQLEYLASLNLFSKDFLDYLSNFQFTGDIYALPEGSIFFENEPLIQVIASIPEAQFIESALINIIHYHTNVASKAIRCRLAAGNKTLYDFGMRRAHSFQTSVWASYAAFIAGFDGTANIEAGRQFNIPLSGTMAHSFIQAHPNEDQAFIAFSRTFPENSIFLLDTYDTLKALHRLIQLYQDGFIQNIKAIRIDSGDLQILATQCREILDKANLFTTQIIVSGDLDEFRIRELYDSPIDVFAVGTKISVCADTPSLDCVYKLVELDHLPKRKLSLNKATYAGRKQIKREYDNQGKMVKDHLESYENLQEQGLLQAMLLKGKRVCPKKSPQEIQEFTKHQIVTLREQDQAIELSTPEDNYPIEISESIKKLNHEADESHIPQQSAF